MCGIFGYVGEEDAMTLCVKGLEQLEYRGYDSSGIAGITQGKISVCKETGKLSKLKEKITPERLSIAIAHTRWATHGKVTQPNAHPHLDEAESVAIVHNGIIENFLEIKSLLSHVQFTSETDSEVIAQLVAKHYEGDFLKACFKSLPELKGQFSIALIHKNHPDQMIVSAKECPLSIGYNDARTEAVISSDPNAFLGKALNILFLKDGEIAVVEKNSIAVYNATGEPIAKKAEKLDLNLRPATKEGYTHFLLKEIFEQPATIRKALFANPIPDAFLKCERVWLVGCGTSANAGMIGSYFLEDIAKMPASADIASEARFRIVPKNTLIIAISQSGETADTIAAVRELKAQGHTVLGLCNVKNSTLTRIADSCLFLNAGPEMSVCSSKAFTSQIAVLYQLALRLAKKDTLEGLNAIPEDVDNVLNLAPQIQKLAQKYSKYNNFFFMGRRYMYPTAVEAALKLKEISYVNANAYPAGELKHGPIALIDNQFPVIAFCANKQTEEKILSNLQEVKARGAPILAIAPSSLKSVAKVADDVIYLPPTSDPLSPFASTVVGQLLAYYIAAERNCDIDQPRNLAKSVTVE